MPADWQAWAAVGVVLATAGIFLRRALGKKKRGGCSTCGSAGPAIKRR